jgi:hypothetical protein
MNTKVSFLISRTLQPQFSSASGEELALISAAYGVPRVMNKELN